MHIANLHLREKPIKMKPILNILTIANAARGENTVKITTTLLKQIIKEEMAALEEGPTAERVITNKLYHRREDAESDREEDYEVEEVTAYRLVKK